MRFTLTPRSQRRLVGDPGIGRLWRPLALLAAVPKTLSVLSSFSHFSLSHVSYRIRDGHGVDYRAVYWAVRYSEASRIPDRAIHPRGRPAIAPEKIRNAHHGGRAHHHRGSAAH